MKIPKDKQGKKKHQLEFDLVNLLEISPTAHSPCQHIIEPVMQTLWMSLNQS